MVYPEYLAFWIILLPFFVQNGFVEGQQEEGHQQWTTEIYETMVLGNGPVDVPNSTELSILPSSSIVPPTVEAMTDSSAVSTVTTSESSSNVTESIEIGSRLPTDASGFTTAAAASFPSSTPFCSYPFECTSNSFIFDIATFFHPSSATINGSFDGTLTCFRSINACADFCSRFFDGECYHLSSSLAFIDPFNFLNSNCGDFTFVCFSSYYWVLANAMILTTLAICSALLAAYKFIKSRQTSGVTLLSFRYTGNFPDLRRLYNNGEEVDLQTLNLQTYDTVHFDNENGNVTILASKN